ncbi:type VI secretion system lipoprotein TssJ [Hyalangium rubrum]|uniref:Type VI secretion system lipoprotein TssJ n=1 Tax=Hyalangium rubrum TaxID=3103134 RepID=A0ABU5GX34_9BACT|nr:type VI secretion system lipoprotein TssJ [Hyalangium sp. s54d21]MDY7225750.1 type VI secretion system lipoprotein TssJ [Hyalangium sp. s54d21]
MGSTLFYSTRVTPHPVRKGTGLRWWISACSLLTLPACAMKTAAACDKPPPFHAHLEAAERVNPDALGRPLPTVVQFLQLKDSIKLERAGFQKLWAEPKSILGEDLLESAEFIVAPGQTLEHWVQRAPKARYVVAIGLFRQPLGYAWRTVAELPPVPENQCAEEPLGSRGPPDSSDVQLRFKLQGYQIDLLRRSRRTQ